MNGEPSTLNCQLSTVNPSDNTNLYTEIKIELVQTRQSAVLIATGW